MKSENSILLVALVLIVAIGFIGVNYGRVTGEAVKQISSIVVNPSSAFPGDVVQVTARAGCNAGIPVHTFGLYNSQNQRVDEFNMPGSVIRKTPVTDNYYIPRNIPEGRYTIQADDRCSGSRVKGFLDIK